MNALKRLKNLWYISSLNLDKEPIFARKIQQTLGINQAIIVEEDPIDKALREFK